MISALTAFMQLGARGRRDIGGLQHGADVLDQQNQRGKGGQHQVHANRGRQLRRFDSTPAGGMESAPAMQ